MSVYYQDNLSFNKCLTQSTGAFTKLFMIMIQGSTTMLPFVFTTGLLSDGNIGLGSRNMDCLTVLKFPWKIICFNYFLIQKGPLSFKSLMWEKKHILLNNTHRENFIQFSIRIYWNRRLAALIFSYVYTIN